MTDCVLCDWEFAPGQPPEFTYQRWGTFPLKWTAEGPQEISLSDGIVETVRPIATVTHWANEHCAQLFMAIGSFEVSTEMRWASLPF